MDIPKIMRLILASSLPGDSRCPGIIKIIGFLEGLSRRTVNTANNGGGIGGGGGVGLAMWQRYGSKIRTRGRPAPSAAAVHGFCFCFCFSVVAAGLGKRGRLGRAVEEADRDEATLFLRREMDVFGGDEGGGRFRASATMGGHGEGRRGGGRFERGLEGGFEWLPIGEEDGRRGGAWDLRTKGEWGGSWD